MPKIRRKSIENDFLLIFFYIQSKGAAQSSILMILRHPLSVIHRIMLLSLLCSRCNPSGIQSLILQSRVDLLFVLADQHVGNRVDRHKKRD